MILLYPKFYASQRKQKIEIVFPHVVNMMLGMAKGGTPIMKIFKVISEESNVTGEVGKEFGIIITKVEVFHKDLIKSIREVANTTPSELFSDFLDDMVSILEGSGKISEFLDFKSKHLMDEKEKFQSVFINSLGIMAEVYISILVVAPLFLIIIFVVMSMLGDFNQQLMMLVIYVYMPVGGIMFLFMISSMMEGYEVKWTEEKLKKFPLMARIVEEDDDGFQYQNTLHKRLNRVITRIKGVMADIGIFIYKPEYTAYLTIPASVISIPFIINWEIETILIYLMILNFIPFAILSELRKRRVSKIEDHIPDFLKQLASLNESGLNIVVAIRMLSSSNLGILTKEIIKIRKDLEWGMLLPHALKRFEVRVGSATVTQVTSILLRAMESTATVKDALFTAARDAQLYMRFKKNVKNEMFVYIVIIYMTFGVFVFTILILNRNFLQVLPSGTSVQGFSGPSFQMPDVEGLTRLFYHTSLINGLIGGLVAGVMGEGELKSGLKHAILLVFIAFVSFKLFG
jgi:flagellar protein FlaJ